MMAEMFHVFVEGAADGAAEGAKRLADAIAAHYGLPAASLLERIQAGRFRVKGNVDRATAETYVRDLERLGARCTIEPADAANSRPTPLPGFSAQRPATPPAGLPVAKPATPPAGLPAAKSALADAPPSRPSAPPSALAGYARPATPPPVAGAYQSGLAAAFTPDAASSSGGLGALEREDATFSLASVDGGGDDESLIEKSPEPAFGVPASIGPATAKASEPKQARPKDVPVDMFAPPDAESADLKVDIAADEQEFTRKKVATPPAGTPAAPAPPLQRKSQPAIAAQAPVTVKASKLGPLADERVRTIAGVVLAIVIGFVPAHLIASSREKSAFHDIDAQLVSMQAQADTPDAWAQLDQTRATFLERKKDERRSIAIMALAIWAVVGGGIAYGWFRRIPWDDLA
jgi:hypothetical protein